MLFALLCIGHIFLMFYPVNVSAGVVQTDDSNRIQILEGDWQVESVSQFLNKSTDFEDKQQRKTSEPLSQFQDTDLGHLETFDYFLKIYEVRMQLYGQFLVPYVVLPTAITFVVGFLVYFSLASLFLLCLGPWLFHPWGGLAALDLEFQTFWTYFCAIP